MKEMIFQVEFLSDIVLPATSNTEGNIENLDFIPATNFLGMVAKEYLSFKNSFDIFHSGKVRFGDGHILKGDKLTYKMPLSYFHKKLNSITIYNHHKLNPDKDFKSEEKGGLGQLKQKRVGYITKDREMVDIEYNYSQKSAYDKKKRTSLEGSMFGYSSLKAGTKWQFSIRYDESIDSQDIELLKTTLLNSKRLGKSKSAQYGLVKIIPKGSSENIEGNKEPKITPIYLNSRISLTDESGYPTLDLSYIAKDIEIDYSKTQIKTSSFTPYNGARQTKDYQRVCIDKGSVIAIKNITKEQIEEIKNGVGAYLSEGFGNILINPSFLGEYSFEFQDDKEKNENEKIKPIKSDLAKFLQQKENRKKDKLDILNEVDKFIKDKKPLYKNIKSSQWGKIRSICTSGEDNFIEKIREYISGGTKKWEQNQIDTLLNDNNSLEFIKLISIQMPKLKESKDKEQKDEN